MEKSPSVRLYSRAKPVSTLPKAILLWPDGLTNPPRIFPLADSLEEAERIGKFLEKLFGNGQPSV